MVNKLNLIIKIDKDAIVGALTLFGELKSDKVSKDEVRKWLKSHDTVEEDLNKLSEKAEITIGISFVALAGIIKKLEQKKDNKIKEK